MKKRFVRQTFLPRGLQIKRRAPKCTSTQIRRVLIRSGVKRRDRQSKRITSDPILKDHVPSSDPDPNAIRTFCAQQNARLCAL